jgi:hypothetical protein
MSERDPLKSCRDLSQKIRVFIGTGEAGEVHGTPVSRQPLRAESLRPSFEGSKTAYYLDSFEEKACAYPLVFFQNEVNPLAPNYVFDRRYLEGPAHFGIPSQLNLVGSQSVVKGMVYDPSTELFFGTVLSGLRTYLIGPAENHHRLTRSVQQFSEFLSTTWKENPLHLLEAIPWDLEDPREFQVFPHSRAIDEISKFIG